MSTTDERAEFLNIYLQDHVAGATAGVRRAAAAAEKLGAMKLNGRIVQRSPLSTSRHHTLCAPTGRTERRA